MTLMMKTESEILEGYEKYLEDTERKMRNSLKPDHDENEAYVRGYMGGMRKMMWWMVKP